MRRRVMDDDRVGRQVRRRALRADDRRLRLEQAFGKGVLQGDGTLSSFLNYEPGYRITECRA